MRAGPVQNAQLVERERECLRLIAQGHEDLHVAQLLGIKARTVRFHITNARLKLCATNRVHAVVLALRANLLDL